MRSRSRNRRQSVLEQETVAVGSSEILSDMPSQPLIRYAQISHHLPFRPSLPTLVRPFPTRRAPLPPRHPPLPSDIYVEQHSAVVTIIR